MSVLKLQYNFNKLSVFQGFLMSLIRSNNLINLDFNKSLGALLKPCTGTVDVLDYDTEWCIGFVLWK